MWLANFVANLLANCQANRGKYCRLKAQKQISLCGFVVGKYFMNLLQSGGDKPTHKGSRNIDNANNYCNIYHNKKYNRLSLAGSATQAFVSKRIYEFIKFGSQLIASRLLCATILLAMLSISKSDNKVKQFNSISENIDTSLKCCYSISIWLCYNSFSDLYYFIFENTNFSGLYQYIFQNVSCSA